MVLSLLDVLPAGVSYRVFYDNFFTSFRLLQHLGSNNIRASNTVNQNRLKDYPVMKKKEFEKSERGFSDQRTTFLLLWDGMITKLCTSKFDHSQDVHMAVFCLQKNVQTHICDLIESIIFRASWQHKNTVVSDVKTHVKDVRNVVLVFMIIVKIGMAFAKL